MTSSLVQTVDPAVSRTKFEREVNEFLALRGQFRARGWFLIEYEWPCVTVMLVTPRTTPPSLVATVKLDYTNYDAEPPTVRFVDPFTGRPLKSNELTIRMHRRRSAGETILPDGNKLQLFEAENLLQAHSPDDLPFLCIPGVREYHNHPGHSGDPWELHRSSGAGRLVRLLEIVSNYGLEPIQGFGVETMHKVTLALAEPPE